MKFDATPENALGHDDDVVETEERQIRVVGTVKIEALVADTDRACELLGGISSSTLWRLEKRGIVTRLPDFPKGLYSVDELREVVRKQSKLGKALAAKEAVTS